MPQSRLGNKITKNTSKIERSGWTCRDSQQEIIITIYELLRHESHKLDRNIKAISVYAALNTFQRRIGIKKLNMDDAEVKVRGYRRIVEPNRRCRVVSALIEERDEKMLRCEARKKTKGNRRTAVRVLQKATVGERQTRMLLGKYG